MDVSREKSIADLIAALQAAGLDYLAHESVADFLYLAQFWNLFSGSPVNQTPKSDGLPSEKRDIKNAAKQQADPAPEVKRAPTKTPPRSAANALFADTAGGKEGIRAARIGVADPAALPNRLLVARALRPLARRRLSRRDVELDEESTAEESAHQRMLTPIFRPVKERWFDLLLLTEETVSMVVWQRPIEEFAALAGTHGAFRDVRRATFRVKSNAVEVIEQSGRVTGPRSLLDPEGRRLILLFTHGVSSSWAGGALPGALMEWAKRQPVAIVQMLPEKQWEHTELGEPDSHVRAARPGTPNAEWSVRRQAWREALHPEGIAIPVLTLRHQDVSQWARMLMAAALTDMPAFFLIRDVEVEEERRDETGIGISAPVLVSRFRTNASSEAWHLAVALSGSPLLLPVMRLVQNTIFPPEKIETVHLAELLLSGLLERVHKTDDPERDAFEFYPGVRDLLAESFKVDERYAVKSRVFDYIKQHRDALRVFPALTPSAEGDERIPEWASPFAAEDAGELHDLALVETGSLGSQAQGAPTPEPETYRFFVSYSRRDKGVPEFVERVNVEITMRSATHGNYFISETLSESETFTEIENSLLSSSVFLCMLSPASVSSEWVQADLRRFQATLRPILPVLWSPTQVPLELRSYNIYPSYDMPLSQYEPGSAAYHEAVVGVAQAIMQRIAQSTEEADRRRYLDPSWLSAMASTKGMRHLLEELYAHRTDPAVDQLYWSLLGAVRGEEQDWGDWFANFIATTGTK